MKRTAALSAGAALVLTGAAIFNGPAFSSDQVSNVSSQTTATQTPAEVSPVPATPEHAAQLTQQLASAKVVPGGYELSAVGTQGITTAGPLEFFRIGEDSSAGYKASAVLTDAAGRATLSVFVRSATKPVECKPENHCIIASPVATAASLPAESQSTVHRADGTAVLVSRRTDAGGKVTSLSAEARLADGTVVTAVVRAEMDDATKGTLSTRDSVPLTDEQVTDLAVRPGFHF